MAGYQRHQKHSAINIEELQNNNLPVQEMIIASPNVNIAIPEFLLYEILKMKMKKYAKHVK